MLTFAIMNASEVSAFVTALVPFNQWIRVAGTLDDATGAMKLYVNGAQVASTVTTVRPFALLDPGASPGLGIGSDPTGEYGEFLNGWLDEVRLSDVALNPSQFLIPEPSALSVACVGFITMCCCRRRRTSNSTGC